MRLYLYFLSLDQVVLLIHEIIHVFFCLWIRWCSFHEIIFVFRLSLDQVVLVVLLVHVTLFGSLFVLCLDWAVLCSMLLILSLPLSLDQVLLVFDIKLIF